MKSIKQEHSYGCGVACAAFIVKMRYQDVISAIDDGKNKANSKGFWCKELVAFLNSKKFSYQCKYVNRKIRNKIYHQGTIVFIKRSKKYPSGHYLARYENKWMDPWINFPEIIIKAGFRKKLPGRSIYAILPK